MERIRVIRNVNLFEILLSFSIIFCADFPKFHKYIIKYSCKNLYTVLFSSQPVMSIQTFTLHDNEGIYFLKVPELQLRVQALLIR